MSGRGTSRRFCGYIPPPAIQPPFQWTDPTLANTSNTNDGKYSLSSSTSIISASHIDEANNAIAETELTIIGCEAAIIDEEKKIRQLQRKIGNLEHKERNARRKAGCLLNSLEEYRSSHVSICPSRLPNEILGEIFTHYAIDPTCSPWVLTQICRIWRQVALRTPRLWRGIRIYPNYSTEAPRFYEGKENCITPEHLYRALRRARHAPLDITIHHINGDTGRPTVDSLVYERGNALLGRMRFWEMLDMIGGPRMQQWRSFDLALGHKMIWGDYWEGDVSLQNLESYTTRSMQRPILQLLNRTARKLRKIGLSQDQAAEWTVCRFFNRVEDLCITANYNTGRSASVATAMTTLRSAPQVKYLSIALSQEESTLDSADIFPTTLIELRITSSIIDWAQIISPSSQNLVYLEINQLKCDVVGIPGSIQLPSLVHIKINSALALSGIILLDCPQIDVLELCSRNRMAVNDLAIDTFRQNIAQCLDNNQANPFPVRRLAIDDTDVSANSLRQLLVQMPLLEELKIKCTMFPKSFFNALSATRKVQGVATLTTCPILRRARFDMLVSGTGSGRHNGETWEEVFPVLKDIVRLRERLGSPLEIFDFPRLKGEGPLAAVAAEKPGVTG